MFRPRTDDDPLTVLTESVVAFIESVCAHHEGVKASDFLAWKVELLKKARERLLSFMPTSCASSDSTAKLKLLTYLQRVLVLVLADEAANNTVFVCKRVSCQRLRDELRKIGGAYYPVAESTSDVTLTQELSFSLETSFR